MKYVPSVQTKNKHWSRPARGAWVEIKSARRISFSVMSRPARGAWVEIVYLCRKIAALKSRPARGAWVEIERAGRTGCQGRVAPRKGRVG